MYDGKAAMKGKRLPVTMNAFGESLCTPDRNPVMACWAAANTPRPTAVELWKVSRGRESGSSGVGRGLNDAAGRHLKLDECIKNLKSKLTIVDDNIRRPKFCIDGLECSSNALRAAGINFDRVEPRFCFVDLGVSRTKGNAVPVLLENSAYGSTNVGSCANDKCHERHACRM